MYYTFIIPLIHILGGLTFVYTGSMYCLLPGAAIILYNLYTFVKISALVLSPDWDIELEFDGESSKRDKLLLQFSSILTIFPLYQLGFEFYAGVASLYWFIAILSCLITTSKGEEENHDQ